RQIVLFFKLGLRSGLIGRNSNHHRSLLGELLGVIAKLTCFHGTARRVGFRIEIQHHALTLHVGQLKILAGFGPHVNLGSLVAYLQHSICLYPSFCFSNSVTTATLACPRVAFITCPTRKLMTVVLPPRYCSTCFGLFSITSAIVFSSA